MKLLSSFLFALVLVPLAASAHAEVAAPAKKEKGIACTARIVSRHGEHEQSTTSKYRVDSIAEARRLGDVRSYPRRDVVLGKLTVIESVMTMNFERRRPRATLEVVFEAEGATRDTIKVSEKGRGKSAGSKNVQLADGTTMFVDVELACAYYRS